MRSSLFKHIWLIQPPDPLPPVPLVDAAGGATVRFVPSWQLMCLEAFLMERTGHTCGIIDIRIHDQPMKALDILSKTPDGKSDSDVVAIIYAGVLNLGPVSAIVSHIHKFYPSMTIVLSGPLVESFPDLLKLIPHVQYGLSGDPEVILRNLLDFIDISHRLKLVPGLIMPNEPTKQPHWMDKLQGLSLPEWYRVQWSDYQINNHSQALRAEAKLSRGMPSGKASMAFSKPNEPVRIWSLAVMAQSFQKCAGQGISEIFLADPPEFWSEERILEWCRLLNDLRNTQPWAIQLFPKVLSPAVLDALGANACHRVEFIIPTCDPALLFKFGITIGEDEFRRQNEQLTLRKVNPQLIYWIQGPGEAPGEADRVYRHIIAMGFPKFALHPFPLNHDSRLYQDVVAAGGKPPPISEWIAWAQNPETSATPVALWEGSAGLHRCRSTMHSIQRKVMRNPRRYVIRFLRRLHQFGSVALMEQKIADWFSKRSMPSD